jgi:hypothetical protein
MAKLKTRKDPVFGDLENVAGDMWRRGLRLKFLGKECNPDLMVDIDESGPEENVGFQDIVL